MQFEVYEDNAGRLYVFATNGGVPVWADTYYEDGPDGMTGHEMCAADYVGLTVQGLDPIAEEWDGVDDPAALYDTVGDCREIADAAWFWLMLGVDVDACSIAGRQFAQALGIDCEV